MVDFRYHLASLMAVFLALGIGMLIGNSFVGMASVESQGRYLHQLQEQVSEVSRQVRETHQQNTALQQQMAERDRAERALAPLVVKDMLSGRRVAIVLIGQPQRPETATEISNVLTASGASVAS